MPHLRKKKDKNKYDVTDHLCIGRECLAASEFTRYSTSISGARGATDSIFCCLTRAYHGCPYKEGKLLPYNAELAASRKAEGWRNG